MGAGCGQNLARQILLKCGGSIQSNAFVVNKVCGSSLKAIQLGYNAILVGDCEIILAGGVESMSNAPYLLESVRGGYKMGEKVISDSMIKDGLTCAINKYHMGITAENLAQKYGISRQDADSFALDSQKKASFASKNGKFNNEIVPIKIKDKKSEISFENDEFIKHDASLEGLNKLKPAFKSDGVVSAGNSSGINDGAAILCLMSDKKARDLGLKPLAYIKAIASVGVEPSIMGIGAAMAAKKVLKKAKLNLNDIDLIEANEAFATQSLACIKELGADESKINVNGGAIALGHPIGASGARITTTLLYEMQKQNKTLGLATLCIGGGNGISMIVERK